MVRDILSQRRISKVARERDRRQGTATLTVTAGSEAYNADQTARAWTLGTPIVPVVTQAGLLATFLTKDLADNVDTFRARLTTLQGSTEQHTGIVGVRIGRDLISSSGDVGDDRRDGSRVGVRLLSSRTRARAGAAH